METIDVICAYSVDKGDILKVEGITYRVIDVVDEDDIISLDVEALDSTEGEELLVLEPHETVEILAYV